MVSQMRQDEIYGGQVGMSVLAQCTLTSAPPPKLLACTLNNIFKDHINFLMENGHDMLENLQMKKVSLYAYAYPQHPNRPE